MEKLTFYVENSTFILQTEKTTFFNLRMNLNGKETKVKEVSPTKWIISLKEILPSVEHRKENRIFLYYDEQRQIDASNFDIDLENNLTLKYKHYLVFGYISVDHKLRLIIGQSPSARGYYISSAPSKILSKNNNLMFTLDLNTKYVKVKDVKLYVSNRQENFELTIASKTISSKKRKKNIYTNQCYFFVSTEDFINKLDPYFNYNEYNNSIFDYYFTFTVVPTPLTNYKFRIPFSENIKTEIWSNFGKNQKCLFDFYQTGAGNLSNRIGTLKNDIYSYYISLKKEKHTKNNHLILICEYPHKAQDNGFFFFKYLMSKQKQYTPYYIVTDDSIDLPNLKNYRENVVFFKSKEHINLLFKAKYLVHSHTSSFAFPFLTESLIRQRKEMKKIFLGHGITASKNVNSFYGKGTNPDMTDMFIVSSEREKRQVHEQLHYPLNNIKITGLARFDYLIKENNFLKSYFLKKKVLIMPTWRKGQNKLSDDDFKKTKFFLYYSSLITNPKLKKLTSDKKVSIGFYLHNNFQKYSHLFNSDFVRVLKAEDGNVQSLLKNYGILITDYSSVGLDFAIQHRKVLYYQFDINQEEMKEGIKNNPAILPGPIYDTEDKLVIGICEAIRNNKLKPQYLKIVKTQLYPFYDTNACKRIFDVLKELDGQ